MRIVYNSKIKRRWAAGTSKPLRDKGTSAFKPSFARSILVLVIQWQLFPSIVLLSSMENPDSLFKVSDVIRRGQDSNLQSSGHGPDESTNSSTPLVPLLFVSLFPPNGFGCLAVIEPALRLRLGAPVGAPLFPSPALRA